MPRGRGHNRYEGGTGKYSQGNRYEAGAPQTEANTTPGTFSVPAVIPPQPEGDWRARRSPEIAVYEPLLGDSYGRRAQAKRLASDLTLATTVAQAGTQFYQAVGRLEQARQDLEVAHERRGSVPLVVAHERIQLEQRLLKAASDFEAAKDDRETQRTDRARRRQLDDQDFQLAVLAREAEAREQEARIATAEVQLSFAQQIGQRRGEAELAKVETDALRSQADAEGERRRLGQERRKRRDAEEPREQDDMPEPLRRHLVTEREVARSRSEAGRQAQTIRDRASAHGRELTPDEIEQIDMLENAAAAAEDSIRRGEASDIEAS